ncbi:1-deoxyxylulose-5-phosphate synthase YajO-like [Glandiceps talaboti]
MAALSRDLRCKYAFLGKSGLKVSNICLGSTVFGTNKAGRPGQCDEKQAHSILDRFAERGGNFIDTSDDYSDGQSETIIGNWLSKHDRDNFVVATKNTYMKDKTYSGIDVANFDPNTIGLSRKALIRSVDASLKRLQTDYIDLYQIHVWDDGTPIEETLRTLDDLVRVGKIRYVGASNVLGWQLQKIMMTCQHLGINQWISLSAQYNLLSRWTELELTDVCRNEGLGLLAWSPLKGGWLTGKIRREHTEAPPNSRILFSEMNPQIIQESHPSFSKFAKNEQVFDLLDLMEDIGKQCGKSITQIALRWLLQKDVVSSVTIGAKTLQQLDENMDASSGWQLSDEQMADLDRASEVEISYPYGLVKRANKSRQRRNKCT